MYKFTYLCIYFISFICLTAYQMFMGYLMSTFDSILNVYKCFFVKWHANGCGLCDDNDIVVEGQFGLFLFA